MRRILRTMAGAAVLATSAGTACPAAGTAPPPLTITRIAEIRGEWAYHLASTSSRLYLLTVRDSLDGPRSMVEVDPDGAVVRTVPVDASIDIEFGTPVTVDDQVYFAEKALGADGTTCGLRLLDQATLTFGPLIPVFRNVSLEAMSGCNPRPRVDPTTPGVVWVLQAEYGKLARLDLATGTVSETSFIDAVPEPDKYHVLSGLTMLNGVGYVWVGPARDSPNDATGTPLPKRLIRIDPTNGTTRSVPLESVVTVVGSVLYTESEGRTLSIDPTTLATTPTDPRPVVFDPLPVPGGGFVTVTGTFGSFTTAVYRGEPPVLVASATTEADPTDLGATPLLVGSTLLVVTASSSDPMHTTIYRVAGW